VSETGGPPLQRFVPPTWLRWLNLPASLILAVIILGPLTQVLPEILWIMVAVVVLPAAMTIGWRGAKAEVVVDAESVVYRGLTRTTTIRRSALLGYADYSPGWASWAGDVPEVAWESSGRRRTTRLWVFVLRPDVRQVGSGEVRDVREALRRVLSDAVRQAHRDRKRRGRTR
jgi:hypothetical protein